MFDNDRIEYRGFKNVFGVLNYKWKEFDFPAYPRSLVKVVSYSP